MSANSPILLFRLGGLGDLMVALPSILYLRQLTPGRALVLVCRKEYGLLLHQAGVVDEITDLGERRVRPVFSGLNGADQETIDWLKSFSRVVAWLQRRTAGGMDDGWKCPGLPPFHGIIAPEVLSMPVSRYFFEQTAAFFPGNKRNKPLFEKCARLPLTGKPGENKAPDFPWPRPKKYFVIHPGSGGERKCWPLEKFLEIIRRLGQAAVPGFLVTGETEERYFDQLSKEILPEKWSWIRRPSLSPLARLLGGSSYYIGNDSGVTHLAAACGTRVLALFREDLESVWKPYGRCRTISAPQLSEIDLDQVWRAVAEENGFS